LGVGPAAQRASGDENWWDRDEPIANPSDAVPMTLGHQAELFDEAGHAAIQPVERAEMPAASTVTMPAAKAVPQTIVSVYSRSKSTARVVATTRVVSTPRVSAVAKTATVAQGAVARQLFRSQSISSGREESRWFSVPQRVLLPRFQLFEGAEAVTEDRGSLRIGSPATRSQRGRVWFV
jgi:hypothetical protein